MHCIYIDNVYEKMTRNSEHWNDVEAIPQLISLWYSDFSEVLGLARALGEQGAVTGAEINFLKTTFSGSAIQ